MANTALARPLLPENNPAAENQPELSQPRLPAAPGRRQAPDSPQAEASPAPQAGLERDQAQRVTDARFSSGGRVYDVKYAGDTTEVRSFIMKGPNEETPTRFTKAGPQYWLATSVEKDGTERNLGPWQGEVSFNNEGYFCTKSAKDDFWQLRNTDETIILAKPFGAGENAACEYKYQDGRRVIQGPGNARGEWNSDGTIALVQHQDGTQVKPGYSGGNLEQVDVLDAQGAAIETWKLDRAQGKWISSDTSHRASDKPPLDDDGTYRFSQAAEGDKVNRVIVRANGERQTATVTDWENLTDKAKAERKVQIVQEEQKPGALVYPSGEVIDNIKWNGQPSAVNSFRMNQDEGSVTYTRIGGDNWRYEKRDLSGKPTETGQWRGEAGIDGQGRFSYKSVPDDSFWQVRDVDGSSYQIRELENGAIEQIHADKTRSVANTDGSAVYYDADNVLSSITRADKSKVETVIKNKQLAEVTETDAQGHKTVWKLDEQDKKWKAAGTSFIPTDKPPVDRDGNVSRYTAGDKPGIVLKNTVTPMGKREEVRTTLDLAAARDELVSSMNEFNKYHGSEALQKRFRQHLDLFEDRMIGRAEYQEQCARSRGERSRDFREEALMKVKQTYDEMRSVLASGDQTLFERDAIQRKALEPGWRTIERLQVVEEYLHHLASPGTTNVDQGGHNSCAVTMPEKFIMNEHPEQGARILKELLFTEGFTGADGRRYSVPAHGLRPGMEESQFDINTAHTHSGRSRVSLMLENALGTAYNQLSGRGAVYLSEHGWSPATAKIMAQLAVGKPMPLASEYTNEQLARAIENGEMTVVGTSGGSHAWTINAAYPKREDGTRAVVVSRDDQNNDAENYQAVSSQSVANASGTAWGNYTAYPRRWRR